MSDRRAERGVLHYLLLGINAGVFALVAAVAALVLIVPAATGSVALTVLTGSMEPGLPPGSMVVVRPTDPADVRIGDVITYQWEPGEPTLVTHRVTEAISNSDGSSTWTTQGDNNPEPDPNPVTQDQLRGVVWYSLPLLGWVTNLVAGDLRPVLVPVIGGALLVYAAVLVVQTLRGRRRTTADGADAEPAAERGRRSRRPDGRRAAAAPQVEPEPTAIPLPPADAPRRGARRDEPAPGPRRSTFIAAEPAEAPVGRRARRAAERAAEEGEGTGLASFVTPEPSPEPARVEPAAVEQAPAVERASAVDPAPSSEAAPVSRSDAQSAEARPAEPELPLRRSRRSVPDVPQPVGDEPLRRPRGKGRSYR